MEKLQRNERSVLCSHNPYFEIFFRPQTSAEYMSVPSTDA